jgi:glycosyltransferase involved in cell wall biosynthesis
MQCAQSESRFRGIGRYALGLCKAIARIISREPEHELYLFVNESISDAAAQLRIEFADLVSASCICGFYSVGVTAGQDPENDERRGVSEVIRESALSALRPDAVLVMSLFEGFGGGAISSIKGFVGHLPTATILYDLIPMLAPDHYLANPTMRAWYERKVLSLRNSDLLFAISDTARDQASELLGFASECLVTIGTGLDDRFKTQSINPEEGRAVFERFGITRKAVLYAGGFDRRKNIDVLIEAFAGVEIGLREERQLVIAGRCPLGDLDRLTRQARSCGLTDDDLLFTGHVTDEELVTLYQHCELFVFPSTLEGFGLPPLEALACGAPVLSVETPSMIGLHAGDGLLVGAGVDPLRLAMEQTLGNEARLAALRVSREDLTTRFDWHRVAQIALASLKALAQRSGTGTADLNVLDQSRPRLALVAPLPSAAAAITNYFVELVPALHRHYVVEVIVGDQDVDTSWIPEWIPLRSLAWFQAHGDEFERVLYYIGNAVTYAPVVPLLMRFPGAVVLNDFFLGDLQQAIQDRSEDSTYLARAIAYDHGPAGGLLAHEAGVDVARMRLPCSLQILEAADCVIVHDEATIASTRDWFGTSIARKHIQIPIPRGLARLPERGQARTALGIDAQEVVVCVLRSDREHRDATLIGAWDLLDPLVRSAGRLVLIGSDMQRAFEAIATNAAGVRDMKRIDVTGELSLTAYRAYLAASDIAVYLGPSGPSVRASAPLFDALGAGLAVIIDDYGNQPGLPDDTVLSIPSPCTSEDLAAALCRLIVDPALRSRLARKGRDVVRQHQSPVLVAREYARAIESGVQHSPRRNAMRLRQFAIDWASRTTRDAWHLDAMAHAVARANIVNGKPRLFVDVSSIAAFDLRTGIQRVVRALLLGLMRNSVNGLRVEAVRADLDNRQYRYASRYISTLLDIETSETSDDVIEPRPGDIFLGLDLAGEFVTVLPEWFRTQKEKGVRIVFVAYDLLPVRLPEFFPEGMDIAFAHWLQTIGKVADEVLCISASVAQDLVEWLDLNKPSRRKPLRIGSFHLGADLGASAPTRGLPPEAGALLEAIRSRPSFLMVGTVEPRKGHTQVLAAVERLWQTGNDIGLVIVGKSGWLMDAFLEGVSNHSEFGKRLFWLERITDEFLDEVYPACVALIAASHGEGFGLPLIESAKHGLPIIARDLPVFREVAGEHAFYFEGVTAPDLADALSTWSQLHAKGTAPTTDGITFYSWKESAEQVLALLEDDAKLLIWDTQTSIARGEQLGFDSVKLDWEGWSPMERSHRWSEGKQSRVGFFLARDGGVPQTLELLAGTFGEQPVVAYLNGTCVLEEKLQLADDIVALGLPRDALLIGEQNWIEFRLPGATSPGEHDQRRIALYVKSLCFR